MRRLLLWACGMAMVGTAFAQHAGREGSSADEIARKLADPGAAMVSVPFQYNYLGGVGPGGTFHNQVLKIQPVIPFVGERGKFLLRPILPLVSNEFPLDKSGVGDLFVQGYYIPHREVRLSSSGSGLPWCSTLLATTVLDQASGPSALPSS